MKSPLQHRNARVSPSETLTPPPHKNRPSRLTKENLDPNPISASPLGKNSTSKFKSGLPPRPPNPLKRKLHLETLPENNVPPSLSPDPGVQVIVRIRPPKVDEEEENQIVNKISCNSISFLDHVFAFDSVADGKSMQQDIFNLVGISLVENCLAGFNSSIFAYGQTGSGKTYTMWGPPSVLSEDNVSSDERGLTPRVFERLFSRMNEEQAKSSEKQLSYECRCSFWEIYNEQITDLLDPVQKNLQIREDTAVGVYVDDLKVEPVSTTKDITQLLLKGLSNRRTGATTVNAESSRSHCVFTCVVASQSVSDGLSSLRTSRINLVDLAGSERQKLTDAAGNRLREAGNINRSLSQLGNLINILAEVSQTGKQRHIPYRDSKLTFLLQDSLGGNAKLAMICAISPSQSCKNETLSTLRFAQRAKAIKNKAIINEIQQDDVNVLRDQIRQLKDELLRMKSNGYPAGNGSYSTGWNARRSLSLLRMSLNRPSALPVVEDDSDEEMEIDENDVERPHIHVKQQSSSRECQLPVQSESLKGKKNPTSDSKTVSGYAQLVRKSKSGHGCNEVHDWSDVSVKCHLEQVEPCQICPVIDVTKSSMIGSINKSRDGVPVVQVMDGHTSLVPDTNKLTEGKPVEEKVYVSCNSRLGMNFADTSNGDLPPNSAGGRSSIISPSSLDSMPCQTSPVLNSPTLRIYPTVESERGKSLRTSSAMSASQNNKLANDNLNPAVLNISSMDTSTTIPLNASLTKKRKNRAGTNDHLTASIHRGLQVIDNLQYSSALRMSSFRFSMRHNDVKTLMPMSKVDIGVQTITQESEEMPTSICRICKNNVSESEHHDIGNDNDLQLVTVNGTLSVDKLKKQVPKAVEKVLAGAIRREMAFEDQCTKQAAETVQLNRLVQQYKHERECNAIILQICEDKIARLESLMDGVLPTEDFMEKEFLSLTDEHEILKRKYENHPEVLRVNIELKRAVDELDGYRNFFDLGERDVLVEEIVDLRAQLQYYMASSSMPIHKPRLHKFIRTDQLMLDPTCSISEMTEESGGEKLEQERSKQTNHESKWISLSEELRHEVEASRSIAEKQKLELDIEKKCAEELKEALQTAMQGHARILEQYADLQEKHIALLGRHRKISDGIEDVKRAAAKAGIKGPESKFINSLAAEISALRVEREKERRYWSDENKGLQAQLRDTAEAVQAAGELLVRLKDAEESVAVAEKRASVAEQETEKAYQEIDRLKENYDREIVMLNKFVEESRLPKETIFLNGPVVAEHGVESHLPKEAIVLHGPVVAEHDGVVESITGQCWKQELEPLYFGGEGELSKGTDPNSWYSGYDRCNI